jgi:hypothetical protein
MFRGVLGPIKFLMFLFSTRKAAESQVSPASLAQPLESIETRVSINTYP